MAKHALLSASSAYRWLACPPSAKACENIPDESSPYAKQGTDAHTLCEYKIHSASLGGACVRHFRWAHVKKPSVEIRRT